MCSFDYVYLSKEALSNLFLKGKTDLNRHPQLNADALLLSYFPICFNERSCNIYMQRY